jgi:hypothetical protein
LREVETIERESLWRGWGEDGDCEGDTAGKSENVAEGSGQIVIST